MCFKLKALLFMTIPFIWRILSNVFVKIVFFFSTKPKFIQNIVEVGMKFTFILSEWMLCLSECVSSCGICLFVLLSFFPSSRSIWAYWMGYMSVKRMSIIKANVVKISFSLCLLFYMKNHRPQLKYLLVNIYSHT